VAVSCTVGLIGVAGPAWLAPSATHDVPVSQAFSQPGEGNIGGMGNGSLPVFSLGPAPSLSTEPAVLDDLAADQVKVGPAVGDLTADLMKVDLTAGLSDVNVQPTYPDTDLTGSQPVPEPSSFLILLTALFLVTFWGGFRQFAKGCASTCRPAPAGARFPRYRTLRRTCVALPGLEGMLESLLRACRTTSASNRGRSQRLRGFDRRRADISKKRRPHHVALAAVAAGDISGAVAMTAVSGHLPAKLIATSPHYTVDPGSRSATILHKLGSTLP